MFYTFNQNNSGGRFAGPAKHVIIEADSADEACEIATNHDVYFEGCDKGFDCPCCGDRWYTPCGDDDCTEEPMIYNDRAEEFFGKMYVEDIPYVLLVRKDGTQEK